jgi:spore germination cell wall hydrolase CwlJ-like protein
VLAAKILNNIIWCFMCFYSNVSYKYIILLTCLFQFCFVHNAYTSNYILTKPSKNDIYWLAQNIYHEARGESLEGQLMVGIVTVTRMYNGKWGNTIKDVVTAPYQFSWYNKNKKIKKHLDIKAWNQAKLIARYSFSAYNLFKNENIMYYHRIDILPEWSARHQQLIIIGNHIFYNDPLQHNKKGEIHDRYAKRFLSIY